MKKIIFISTTIPFIMHTFVFGVKDSLYLFPLWAASITWFMWAYYFIKVLNEYLND